MDADEIKRIVTQINRDVVKGEKEVHKIKLHYMIKYKEFTEKYPMLFDMALQKNCNFAVLDQMFFILNKQPNFEEASKEAGQMLFDKYVKDTVDKLDKDLEKGE